MEIPKIVATYNFIAPNGIKLIFTKLNKTYFLTENFLEEHSDKLQSIHDKYFKSDEDIEYNKQLEKLINEKVN